MTQTTDPEAQPDPTSEEVAWRASLDGYDIHSPSIDVELPQKLREISGLVVLDKAYIACIQDERGTIFFFDPAGQRESIHAKFTGKGDFEALCRAGDSWLALRSDGVIFEVAEGMSQHRVTMTEVARTELDLPHREYESLAHDPIEERLLIAPKDRAKGDEFSSNEAPVYALALDGTELPANPSVELAFVLDRKELRRQAEAKGLPLRMETTKKGNVKSQLSLRISDLAVHPRTGHYFVLSGSDQTLLEIDRSGNLVGSSVFPQSALPQAEGIAFGADGTLYLSSEAGPLPAARLFAFPEKN